MEKSKPETHRQLLDDDAKPKVEFLAVTPESDTRELLFRLVEILRKQGITVTPARKGSLLKHDA
jgi:hypothetical protein